MTADKAEDIIGWMSDDRIRGEGGDTIRQKSCFRLLLLASQKTLWDVSERILREADEKALQ